MTVTVGLFLASALASFLIWRVLRPLLGAELLLRENYRHERIPVVGGFVLAVAVVTVTAACSVLPSLGIARFDRGVSARLIVVFTVLGFVALGMIDDLVGDSRDRGFRGHLRALGAGRVTTGLVKLIGGFLVAVVAVPDRHDVRPLGLLLDAVLIAASANLANLLDRAPGRTIKSVVPIVALMAMLVDRRRGSLERGDLDGVVIAVGAGAGLLWADLREELMLGDSGANALGAAAGLGVILAFGEGTRTIALIAVVGLNVASELVSFSAVIAKVPPLRWLDLAGSRRRS